MSSPIDPVILLNVLEPILDQRTGGVRESHLANRLVNVMRDARKLVQRCMYLNIIGATESEETKREIIKLGGWDILYEWLKDAENLRHWSVVIDILQLFINLPVSVDLIRSNKAPKLIRRLSKLADIDPAVRNLAIDVLSIWKDIVIDDHVNTKEKVKRELQEKRSESNSSSVSSDGVTIMVDPNIDVEAAEEPSTIAVSSSLSSSIPRPLDHYGEGKRAENTNTHLKVRKIPPATSSPNQDRTPSTVPNQDRTQSSIPNQDRIPSSVSTQDRTSSSSLPNHIQQQHRLPQQQPLVKLGKSGSSEKMEKLNRKDIEQILKQQHKSNEKEDKSTTEEKKMNNNIDKNPPVIGTKRPQERPSEVSDPFSAALSGMDEAAKRRKTVKTPRKTFRSTGLDQDPEPVSSNMKKRKGSAELPNAVKRKDSGNGHQLNGSKLPKVGEKTAAALVKRTVDKPKPLAIPVPNSVSDTATVGDQAEQVISPTTSSPTALSSSAKAAKVQAHAAKAVQMIESDSFMAALTGSSHSRPTAVIRKKKVSTDSSVPSKDAQPIVPPKPHFYKEVTRTSDDSSSQHTPDTTNLENNENGGKPGKRRVRWAKEPDLVRVQYFELEEGERAHKVGLNKSNLASLDKKMEREAMEAARKGIKVGGYGGVETETYFTWKLVPVENAIELATRGSLSEEKKTQQERMKNILTEIYFTHDMIPDTPKEPDLFVGNAQSETAPVIIPLEDVAAEVTPVGPPGMITLPPPPAVAASTALPPELAQLLQNLNKSGMMPQAPPSTTTRPPLGFGGPGMGFGPRIHQPPVGVNSQPGVVQQPGFGPPGMLMGQLNQGFPPNMPPPAIYPNQGQPFGPAGGLLGSQPSSGWSGPPPPIQGPSTGGFRAPEPSGFGSKFGPRPVGGNRFVKDCPFFLRGRCSYGEKCRYRHGPGRPEESPSSPPGQSRDSTGRSSSRLDRSRFRSPPRTSGRHRQRSRSPDDKGDKDYRNVRRTSPEKDVDYRIQRHPPTYSPVERYRLSPPAQIMDDTPVVGAGASPDSTAPTDTPASP